MFAPEDHPELLVGLGEPDDAAVYKMDAERALISTTDFFPPVVDDPYDFGAIAAANAMSDVYAMGGDVLFAINLAAWPNDLDPAHLSEVLRGGADKVKEAGAVLAGGHTVADQEPKYGLAVTGQVHPDRILKKGGAQVGDVLILTKALGTGIVTTALKQDKASESAVAACVDSMLTLNKSAAAAARAVGAACHGATDITGFGLAGHASEMATLAGVKFVFDFESLPWLPSVLDYAEAGIAPGGTGRNHIAFEDKVSFTADLEYWQQRLVFDPQTSGGLLISVAADAKTQLLAEIAQRGQPAWVIGHVEAAERGSLEFR